MHSEKLFFVAVLLFSLILLHNSQAQSRWSIGLTAAATYNLPHIQHKGFDPTLGYSAGLSAMRFFTSHVFASAGLAYTQKSFTLMNIPDTRNLFTTGSISYYSMRNYFSYVSLPIEIGYTLFDLSEHKFSFFASSGILLNELLSEKEKSQGLDPSFSSSQSKNAFSTTATVGFGIFYNLSSRFFLMAKPQYSYDFYTSGSDELSDGIKFQGLSLLASLRYRL